MYVYINKKQPNVYCVRLTETIIVVLLVLIASIVIICKSLWIKASAKWLNVMYTKKQIYYCEMISAEFKPLIYILKSIVRLKMKKKELNK